MITKIVALIVETNILTCLFFLSSFLGVEACFVDCMMLVAGVALVALVMFVGFPVSVSHPELECQEPSY